MDDLDTSSLPAGPDGTKRRVTYFYDDNIGNFYYGDQHVMKPYRIRMTHSLVQEYGLLQHMQIECPVPVGPHLLCSYHTEDYVHSLLNVKSNVVAPDIPDKYGLCWDLDGDCPVFPGLFEFCQMSASGSIAAASKLNQGESDITINWAGGLHHAKKDKAFGFCYINDIVLAILELLKVHQRVLYVDIDVHHGDGVEEAFITTDRVMTASFHSFKKGFFPGTGHVNDIGIGRGKYYALNVPLDDGIDDLTYRDLFCPIIQKVMEVYQPNAVVLQCGADSLAGDRLGTFNLSIRGHANCLSYLKSFNVPLLVLGGGGYTIRNVARCWCLETAVAVGVNIPDELPPDDYHEFYGPEYKLYVQPRPVKNQNEPKNLQCIKDKLLERLSRLPHAPSVQFHQTPQIANIPTKPKLWNGEDYDS